MQMVWQRVFVASPAKYIRSDNNTKEMITRKKNKRRQPRIESWCVCFAFCHKDDQKKRGKREEGGRSH